MSLLLNREKRVCNITVQLIPVLNLLYEKNYGIADIGIEKLYLRK